ncbi:MAG: 50S ribosomal protein L16 [Candidatus Niyogibacteria bacterium]|nr:50S ribosomal protein L16 [Candidatus Niyogibacteria bacterium]
MTLFPKKVKHRKWQRLRHSEDGVATRGVELAFGSYGVKAEEGGLISSEQIEAARKAISRYIQKSGKMWIRIFPDRPRTAKPPEVGMGKGKGDPVGYYAVVKMGSMILEIDGLSPDAAREALRKASSKLPVRTKVVSRIERS